MAVYEVLTVALIAILAAAATAAIFVGLMNWVGGFYVVRCEKCHHLTTSSVNHSRESCAHCKHPALMHPIYAMHHSGVRVVDDHLRY